MLEVVNSSGDDAMNDYELFEAVQQRRKDMEGQADYQRLIIQAQTNCKPKKNVTLFLQWLIMILNRL